MRSNGGEILRAARPWQWVKNGVVLLPWIFARRFTDAAATLDSWGAAGAFCALSAATYLWNDVRDRVSDAANPLRRERPLAAGRLAPRTAVLVGIAAALVGLAVLAAFAPRRGGGAFGFGCAYLALTSVYTLVVPRNGVLGASVVATGFVLRVGTGGAAAGITVSYWLICCVFLGALTVAIGKRAAEARFARAEGDAARRLNVVARIVGSAFVATYCLYTISDRTFSEFGTLRLIATVPCVALGALRFLHLAGSSREACDPARSMLLDRTMQFAIIGYALAVLWAFDAGSS